MFYTIYTSSDDERTYNYKVNPEKLITNGNDHKSCIICWTTDDYKNRLQYLKDFNEYLISCDCNVLIHYNCLKKWFQTTNSCPICRKKITENLIANGNNNFTMVYYYICYKYLLRVVRVVSIVFVLKITLIIVYNIYYDIL